MIDPPRPPSMIVCAPAITVFHVPVTLMSITSRNASGVIAFQACGGGDAGVGDDDVESAEFGDTVVDGFAQAVEVAGVDGGGDDAAAGGFDEAHRFLQILLRRRGIRHAGRQLAREVDRDDVGAF